jgi:predicted RNA-binding protein with PUA-like domain
MLWAKFFLLYYVTRCTAAATYSIHKTKTVGGCPVTQVPDLPCSRLNPVTYYLAKTDPETYSIDDLEREHRTVWDGVTNPQAVRAILSMQPGDKVFIYHSGGVSGVVGLATVKAAGRPDPKNPKSAVTDLEFTTRLNPPTSLAEIKQSKLFDDWALVRQGRLSTMAAPDSFVAWMRKRYQEIRL